MRYNVNEFADQPLFGLPVAVIDFETTGLDPNECRAIEMAIVHLNLGEGNAEVVLNQRFNPGIPIPLEASMIHGVGDSQVKDCPSFGEYWPEIESLLEGRVLAAYNLPYDWTLLIAEYRRHKLWQPTHHQDTVFSNQLFGICGLVMARAIDCDSRGKGYHRLVSVCERRGLDIEQAHAASSDAYSTALLIEILMKELAELRGSRFTTMRDFWGWQKIKAIEQEAGLREWLKRKGVINDIWPWTDY